jgi:hypothetical protein
MRRGAIAVLLTGLTLPLLGCFPEQQQALNACVAHYPFRGAHPVREPVVTPITKCMADRGYRMDFDGMSCQPIAWPRRSAYCYAPESAVARMGYRIEMLFRGAPKPPPSDVR